MNTATMKNGVNGSNVMDERMDETAKLRKQYPNIKTRVAYILKQYPQYSTDYDLVFVMYKIIFENAEIKSEMHKSEGKGFFESMLDLMTTGASYTAVERARRYVIEHNPRLLRKLG